MLKPNKRFMLCTFQYSIPKTGEWIFAWKHVNGLECPEILSCKQRDCSRGLSLKELFGRNHFWMFCAVGCFWWGLQEPVLELWCELVPLFPLGRIAIENGYELCFLLAKWSLGRKKRHGLKDFPAGTRYLGHWNIVAPMSPPTPFF